MNRIGGVMVGVLAQIAIDHGFGSRSCQTKEYKSNIVTRTNYIASASAD